MTPQEARQILHQAANRLRSQGRSDYEFRTLMDYSPELLGTDFYEAYSQQGEIIEHIITFVWNPTKR